MKKLYNTPSINISLFEKEDVVTTASSDSGMRLSSEEAGKNFLEEKLGKTAVILTF